MASERGLPKCGFAVDGTKKGALPIKVESRAKGKKVTLIENVRGDGQLLCSTLTSLLGTGGILVHQSGQQVVQLQGNQQERVSNSLRDLDCLRGVKEDEKPKKATKQNEVATRHCAYDKFLRQESKPSLAKLLEGEAYAPKCLPGAECFRWHGYWVYCRGCCEQTDDSDVWEESGRFNDPSLDHSGYCEDVDLGAPLRPRSVGQLDDYLRKLGMLAEVGEAALTWGLRSLRGGTAVAPLGTTLAEYRRMAVGPGARLITTPWDNKGRTGLQKQKVKATASLRPPVDRSKSQPPKVPQDEGCFKCPTCQHHFKLYKTLQTHMKLSHNEAAPPKQLVAYTPPKLKPTTTGSTTKRPASRGAAARSLPPRPREKPVARWGKNAPPVTQKVEVRCCPTCDESVGNLDQHLPNCLGPEPSMPPPPVLEPTGSHLEAGHDAAPAAAPRKAQVVEDGKGEEVWEDCPICKQTVNFKMLQAHVERCLQSPPPTEFWKECPVCQEKFHPDAIDAHVQSCLEEQALESDSDEESDNTSEASDGITGHPLDLNGYPVVRVVQGFRPDGTHQIGVGKGDLFLRLWQQPSEEGGYWAWGCLVTWENHDYYGSKLGYVPLSHLAPENVAEATHEVPTASPALPNDLCHHPVVRVLRDFVAEGDEETTGQITVAKDEWFLLEWQQPVEEGGHWAWGCLVTPGRDGYDVVKWGYVPQSHLATPSREKLPSPVGLEAGAPSRRWARRQAAA